MEAVMKAETWDKLAVEDTQANCFVRQHFGAVDLGHKARNDCLLRVAKSLCRHPGGTLPTKLANPTDYKAMDRLMNRAETTYASVLAGHLKLTRDRIASRAAVTLVLHDATTLDYSGLKSVKLGPVGDGNGHGYLCHNSLAVDPQRREVLGLANQILHRRAKVKKGEGVKAKRERKSRESRLWSEAVEVLGRPGPGTRCIDVADRGADVYEFLATEQRLGRACLVRACYNRVIERSSTSSTSGKMSGMLFDHLRGLPAAAIRVRTIHDPKHRRERDAKLAASWAEVWLQPPHTRKGEYEKEPIRVWALRIWEPSPPRGGQAVEWMLLSLGEAIVDEASAWEKEDWYACRIMVEEYHKAKKTGCQIEDLQFHTEQALQPMIALLSVVAVLLLNLRLASRHPEADKRSATELVDPIYEQTLRKWRYKQERRVLTVKEYYLALARLGGHMNRKSDGMPGWLVLWRGWMKLHWMVAGVEATLEPQISRGQS
jgi:hypothetical protein